MKEYLCIAIIGFKFVNSEACSVHGTIQLDVIRLVFGGILRVCSVTPLAQCAVCFLRRLNWKIKTFASANVKAAGHIFFVIFSRHNRSNNLRVAKSHNMDNSMLLILAT